MEYWVNLFEHQIRETAYFRWIEGGRRDTALADWSWAERQVLSVVRGYFQELHAEFSHISYEQIIKECDEEAFSSLNSLIAA